MQGDVAPADRAVGKHLGLRPSHDENLETELPDDHDPWARLSRQFRIGLTSQNRELLASYWTGWSDAGSVRSHG